MHNLLWKISTFRAQPEQIPYSILTLSLMTIVNFAIIFAVVLVSSTSATIALWKTAFMLGFSAVFLAGILYLRGFSERFVQTLTGLFGCQAIVLAITLIPYLMIIIFIPDVSTNFFYFIELLMAGLLLVGASIWLFIIYVIAFQHALDISINGGMLMAIALLVINVSAFALLI